jgi:hypothetical protein
MVLLHPRRFFQALLTPMFGRIPAECELPTQAMVGEGSSAPLDHAMVVERPVRDVGFVEVNGMVFSSSEEVVPGQEWHDDFYKANPLASAPVDGSTQSSTAAEEDHASERVRTLAVLWHWLLLV